MKKYAVFFLILACHAAHADTVICDNSPNRQSDAVWFRVEPRADGHFDLLARIYEDKASAATDVIFGGLRPFETLSESGSATQPLNAKGGEFEFPDLGGIHLRLIKADRNDDHRDYTGEMTIRSTYTSHDGLKIDGEFSELPCRLERDPDAIKVRAQFLRRRRPAPRMNEPCRTFDECRARNP